MKTTTVGIIGAGAIGKAFAEQLVKAGMNAILSNQPRAGKPDCGG